MPSPSKPSAARLRVPGAAFLLSQLGAHSGRRWTERLTPFGLDPRHVVLLRHVAAEEGRSQQALGEALGIPPSRMVALVDDLERRGLLERRPNPADRRVRALYLTDEGRKLLEEIMRISAEHERDLTKGLAPAEREQLIALLKRVAASLGLIEGVHPGTGDPPASGGGGWPTPGSGR
jgi:DNA-binding MarR family transcriptional regulator